MLGIYIDPAKLDQNHYIPHEIRRYIDFVRTSRPATPGEEIRMPGESSNRLREANSSEIEIDAATWDQLVRTATECGLDQSQIYGALGNYQDD